MVVHSVNKTLNDVNFSVSVLKGFVIESSAPLENIERKVDSEFVSTHTLIGELSEKLKNLPYLLKTIISKLQCYLVTM